MFEKHVQTAIQLVVVGIVVWSGSQIISLRDSSIRNEEKTVQIREKMIELQSDIASLRVLMAANTEKQMNVNQQLRDLEYRLTQMERRR